MCNEVHDVNMPPARVRLWLAAIDRLDRAHHGRFPCRSFNRRSYCPHATWRTRGDEPSALSLVQVRRRAREAVRTRGPPRSDTRSICSARRSARRRVGAYTNSDAPAETRCAVTVDRRKEASYQPPNGAVGKQGESRCRRVTAYQDRMARIVRLRNRTNRRSGRTIGGQSITATRPKASSLVFTSSRASPSPSGSRSVPGAQAPHARNVTEQATSTRSVPCGLGTTCWMYRAISTYSLPCSRVGRWPRPACT